MVKPQKKEDETESVATVRPAPSQWLIVELEEAIEGYREDLCRFIADRLKDTDETKVGEVLIRCGLCSAPEQAVHAVATALGVKASTLESLVLAAKKWLEQRYASAPIQVRPSYAAAIEACNERGRGVAFLTTAPEEVAQTLFRRLEPDTVCGRLHVVALGDGTFPSPDQWRLPVRAAGVSLSQCAALTTCRSSFKSALIAGLRCVVAPDRFTQAQDFSGADAVFELSANASPSKSDFLEVL